MLTGLSGLFKRNLFNLNKYHVKKYLQTKSIQTLLDSEQLDSHPVRVVGWVKSFRNQKDLKFIHLNDGSDSRNLQLVVTMSKLDKSYETLFKSVYFNTSVEVTGVMAKSTHPAQKFELHVDKISIIGNCEPNSYPFKPRTDHTFEQLRPHAHLRSHVEPFSSILRFRSQLTMSIHEYFYKNSFFQIHTPILSSNNCEGGCETFQVNTNDQDTKLINKKDNSLAKKLKKMEGDSSIDIENKTDQLKHFFLKPVYLTASAQLHLETMTTSLAKVYTLSPTFRAEKSLTRHHLAEFYMLEAEMVDMNNLDQILDFSEDFIKKVSLDVFEKFNKSDLNIILSSTNSKSHAEFLVNLFKNRKFIRITYKEAIEVLNSLVDKKKINKSIKFGEDFNKEQEKAIVDYFDQTPVFLVEYPKSLKPFYMRENMKDETLVDNFDLLAPNVGEIIGGSLREYRLEKLINSIEKNNLDVNLFKEYIETKKFGAMKMGGFGLGLERFIQFLVNVQNIRDVSAYPRSLYSCKM